ncbi:MAG: lipid A biosynthesis lauroyl acyltransferase [Helicobacteraceae bacterium]|jgi:KDO2-lipid IV(A) lauroyltransferase|nr:lipid A biosynthesis lauroyl acyltransferase [Helicobacteraceae bacterium]
MIGYYLFLGFEYFLMLMPRSWRKALFLAIGKLAYLVDKKHRLIIKQNMRFVYGDDVDHKLVDEVSLYGFQSLAMNFLFIVEARHISLEKLQKMITFEGLEHVEKVQQQHRPIVFVTSHYGVWEVGGSAISAFVEPLMFIYKTMKNPYFQDYLLNSRTKFRMNYAERHGALKALIKQMRAKKSTGLLIDTNISRRDGIMVDFLGKSSRQITTPAYLARKMDAALLPVLIYTDDFDNYTVKFFPEIEIAKTDDQSSDIQDATQRATDWLSEQIYKDPRPWFWMHRRWKTDYPEIYKTEA